MKMYCWKEEHQNIFIYIFKRIEKKNMIWFQNLECCLLYFPQCVNLDHLVKHIFSGCENLSVLVSEEIFLNWKKIKN